MLSANGNVMVLNGNGVLFGKNSRIDVGGIVASTGGVNDAAIMRGDSQIELSNFGDGAVINNGTVSISDAGLAAFVAPQVANNGVIQAKLGKVALAAGGESATVDLYGDGLVEIAVGGSKGRAVVENSGTLEGATVVMTAQAAKEVVDHVINMNGVVKATTATVEGGRIVLNGGSGAVNVGGTVNASGASKGGTVKVTGDKLAVNGTIKADGADQGGNVTLWGDTSTMFTGDISALGANGFVETSGSLLGVHGNVTLSEGGEWLLDPTDLRIVAGGGNGGPGTSGGIFSPDDSLPPAPGGDSWYWVGSDYIEAALNNGSNVTLKTHDNGTREGNIISDATITKTAGGDATLKLQAHNNIEINQNISSTAGKLNVALQADYDNSGGTSGVAVNADINTNGGNFTALSPGNQTVAAGAVVNAAGGDIKFQNAGNFSSVDADSLQTTGTGKITISQNAGGSIQNAINAVQNTGTGVNTINVGAGTYDEDIVLAEDNFVLKGANAGIAGDSTTRSAETLITPHSPGITVTGNGNTVDGFAINGASDGVLLDGVDNTTVKNNVITNSTGSAVKADNIGGATLVSANKINKAANGVYVTNATTGNTVIEKNAITNLTNDGIHVEDSKNVLIGGTSFSNNVTKAANNGYFADNVENLEISHNRATNGVIGYNVTNSAGAKINHSVAEGQTTNAYNVSNSANAFLFSNRGDKTGSDAFVVSDSDGVKLKSNTAYLTGGNAFTVSDSDGALIQANFAGSNNTKVSQGAENVKGDGIRVINSDGVQIKGNTVMNTKSTVVGNGNGIFVSDSDGTVIGGTDPADSNILTAIANNGISLNDDSNVTVAGNSMDGVVRVGIWGVDLSGANINNNVLKNINTGLDGYGAISTQGGSNLIISQNKVTKAYDGVRVMGATGVNLIEKNTLATLRNDGVHVENVSEIMIGGTAFSNNVANAKNNGYYANNVTKLEISHNRATNGTIGYNVTNSAGAKINHSVAEGQTANAYNVSNSANAFLFSNRGNKIGGDAFVVTDSSGAKIKSNTAYKTGGNAFSVSNSDGVLIQSNFAGSNNTKVSQGAENVKGDGIHVVDSEGAQVLTNYVTDVAGNGVFVDPSPSSTVSGNTIQYVGMNGVYVSDSDDITVSKNTISFAGENGVLVENGNAAMIDGNTVFMVENDGIHTTGVDDVTVTGNDVFLTGGNGIYVTDGGTAYITGNVVAGAAWDGIAVNNVYGEDGPTGFSVQILDNKVALSGRHGINVENASATRIAGNEVALAGTSFMTWLDDVFGSEDTFSTLVDEEPTFDFTLNWGNGDGIHVDNVYRNAETSEEGEGPVETQEITLAVAPEGAKPAVVIVDNDVKWTGGDGIEVRNSGSARIARNTVDSTGINTWSFNFDDVFEALSDLDLETVLADGEEVLFGEGSLIGFLDNVLPEPGSVGWGVGDGIHVENTGGDFSGSTETEEGEFDVADLDKDDFDVRIRRNTVSNTGGDGIEVRDSGWSRISRNDVSNTGLNYDNYASGAEFKGDDYEDWAGGSADGIRVSNDEFIEGRGISAFTIGGFQGNSVTRISGNTVTNANDDGIEVYSVDYSLINRNTVTDTGSNGILVTNYTEYDPTVIRNNVVTDTGNNGISVIGVNTVTVDRNTVSDTAWDGIYVTDAFDDVSITDNTVWDNDGNGIETYSTGNTTITGNFVGTARTDGESTIGGGTIVNDGIRSQYAGNLLVEANDVSDTGGNGIYVGEMSGGSDEDPVAIVRGNTVTDAGVNGIWVHNVASSLIDNNTVNFTVEDSEEPEETGETLQALVEGGGNDGILVTNDVFSGSPLPLLKTLSFGGPATTVITGNTVNNAPYGGIVVDGMESSTVTGNVVTNSGFYGFLSQGGYNNNVILAGNELTDNPVGARFESGLIDLTGESNIITGGDIGLQFDPALIPSPGEEPENEEEFFITETLTGFTAASLNLVGDTIGTTVFTGQSTYYIDLENGALFNPGTPTLENGLNATYDGFSPSSTGGVLTQAQFDNLELKIHHYVDDNTLGLFLFGFVPNADIDQEDLFNFFGGFAGPAGRFNITILGLPRVFNGGNLPGGNLASFLAGLSPAAGGNNDQDDSPDNLASIAPAAGGTTPPAGNPPANNGNAQDAACWSQAMAQASTGAPVSYSFGGDNPAEALSQTAACGGT